MEVERGTLLRSHLADFETTTSELLTPSQAMAIMNFAALFHEVIYITDTAVGDHRLIMDSWFRDRNDGLYAQITGFAKAGILKALFRDKVVVRGQLLTSSEPTLLDIGKGWNHRDTVEGRGSGFTVPIIAPQQRFKYFEDVYRDFLDWKAIERYDPDVSRVAFRNTVLEQLGRNDPSTLPAVISQLPEEVRLAYRTATSDRWFTNADLWRIFKGVREKGDDKERALAQTAIILHGHINQQCFADLVSAGQSTYERGGIASFNMELRRKQPHERGIDATLYVPKNLEGLLERAAAHLPEMTIEVFAKLSVDEVVDLRMRAQRLFRIAKAPRSDDPEAQRSDYIRAFEDYWLSIYAALERKYPHRFREPTKLALLREEHLPNREKLRELGVVAVFLCRISSLVVSSIVTASSTLAPIGERFGVALLSRRKQEAEVLQHRLPPGVWYPETSSREVLGLDARPRESVGEQGSGLPGQAP
jgi:hypothetical protein